MVCCLLTSKRKKYPCEVLTDDQRRSAVRADQIKSLLCCTRRAKVSAAFLTVSFQKYVAK